MHHVCTISHVSRATTIPRAPCCEHELSFVPMLVGRWLDAGWTLIGCGLVLAIRSRVRIVLGLQAVMWGGDLIGECFVYAVAAAFVIKE